MTAEARAFPPVKNGFPWKKPFRMPLMAWVLTVFSGCEGPQSMLEAAGPAAGRVIVLWWILFGIAAFVFITVTGFLLVGSFRRGGEGSDGIGGSGGISDRKLSFGMAYGTGITIVLLFFILMATFKYTPERGELGPGALTIDVVGKLWWWEFTYLGEDGEPLFQTANEIHIPVGVPVRFRLRSDNVIHSFWVPRLGGKVDLLPGRTNYLRLEAREVGVYRGQCAEFCGMQHTLMAFLVTAVPHDAFEEWMAAQAEPAREPTDSLAVRGRQVFLKTQCANCHTIRGVSTATEPGPDLTHLASRQTLAAATIPNRKGHLGGWIADPQGIKPGNLMPAVPLASEDFQALLHYLGTLE